MEQALLSVADQYQERAEQHGGRSLARIATIVANRGSFFEPLRHGQTCSVRNFQRFITFFSDTANWPQGEIPIDASLTLEKFQFSASLLSPDFESSYTPSDCANLQSGGQAA